MKGETRPKYIAVLSCSAAGILGVGLWLKPEKLERQVPSPSEAASLQRIVRRQQVDNIADVLAEAALDASRFLVHKDGVTGVAWRDHVLFPPKAPATLPLMAENAPAQAAPDTARSVEGWALLVSFGAGGDLIWTPVMSHGVVARDCHGISLRVHSTAHTIRQPAAGLFDLNSRLVGLVSDCAGEFVVVDAAEIPKLVEASQQRSARARQQFGVELEGDAENRRVRRIWDGGVADRAGLEPGDVVPTSLEELPEQLEVVRNGRRVPIDLSKSISLAATRQGVTLSSVVQDSRAFQAGLREGDTILQIGSRRNLTADQVERSLSAIGPPLFVVYRRANVRAGVTITRE